MVKLTTTLKARIGTQSKHVEYVLSKRDNDHISSNGVTAC